MNKKVKELMNRLGGEWKEVIGYEGLYWVNTEGRVVSKAGNELKAEIREGAELKSRDGKYKMAFMYLVKDCHKKPIKRSKIVAEAFLGGCPAGMNIDHINQNPLDDRLKNLEYKTVADNNKNRDMSAISKKTNETIKKNKEEFSQSDLKGEEWKWINENTDIFRPNRWESGRYMVSNYGRIKDMIKQTMVATKKNASGYWECNLTRPDGSKVNNQRIHRIVAMLFCEGRTRSKNRALHLDDNEGNPKADNLKWGTGTENTRMAFTTGANKSGEKLGIPIVQLTLEGEYVAEYKSVTEAGSAGEYLRKNINNCCRGRQKSHKGYRWLYKSDYESGNFTPLTEMEIKRIRQSTNFGDGAKIVGAKSITNVKYNTEEFKHACQMYRAGLWNSTKACQHAGYNRPANFLNAIRSAISAGVLEGSYEDYVG